MGEKIALVTGGNRGIGLEACRQLADAGLRVILTSRDAAKGQAAAETLRKLGKKIDYVPLDVVNTESMQQAAQTIFKDFGRLDVLVNNAAVYLDEGIGIFDVSMETMRQTMEANFYGPLELCRLFVPAMNRQGYGRVVNISSEMGSLALMEGYTTAYRISKAALNALTRCVAAEARGDVKVNAMCPGWVRTDMGGPNAPRDVVDAVDTLVWLATLPKDGPNGGFFQDRQPLAW